MLWDGRARRWPLFLTTIVVALLWVSAFFVLRGRWFPSYRSHGGLYAPGPFEEICRATLADPPKIPLAGAVGVNLEASELLGQGSDETLARLEENGIRWVRFTLPWGQLEPRKGDFNWAWTDQVFAALAKHPALESLVVLNGSPAWARAPADAGNPSAPPHERADFGAFAAALAERYGDRIRYYQIWHEPNIAPHWGSQPASPADYLGLLREGAAQIRAEDGDATILLAALAPNTEAGGANMSDLRYLDALYRLDARPWFDMVAAEPYGFSEPPSAPPDPARLNFGRAALLRDIMARHGDTCTPVWATSYGWNALPDGWAGPPSPWGQVAEEVQADNAEAALRISTTEWPWLGPLFWAAFCPERAADDPWLGFAVCEPAISRDSGPSGTFRPRPVWQALVAAAQRPSLLPPGDHAVNHPALHYSPGWRVTASAADPSADGDSLEFAFYGSDLALRVQGGPYWALYRIWVDGQPANALPRDESGMAYLVLHDPLAEARVVPVARGLPRGEHRVRLAATGGWGQWALQGIMVADAASGVSAAPGGVAAESFHWAGWFLAGLAVLGTALWIALVWPLRQAQGSLLRGPSQAQEGGLWRQAAGDRLGAMLEQAVAWPDHLLWPIAILLALVAGLSPRSFLTLAALAGSGLLFLVRPDLSLPLIAASIPFWPRPSRLLGREFSLYEMMVWLGVAAVAARWVIGKLTNAQNTERETREAKGKGQNASSKFVVQASRFTLNSLDWPVLALVAVGLASALAADHHDVAFREFRVVFLDGALFYWLVTRTPWPRNGRFSAWPLLNGLIIGAVVVSAVGLWQWATGQGRVDVEGVWRVRGFYGSPNNLALVLDRVIPLALALAAFGFVDREGVAAPENTLYVKAGAAMRATPMLKRIVYGLAAVIMTLACVATFSKGALLLGLPVGMGLVLIFGAWRARLRWPLWVLGGLVLAGAVGLAFLLRTPRFADLFNFQAGTSFFRLKLWQGAWHMALDHPWLGVGPDNFLYAYRTRYVLPSAWQELNLSHPHNILLDFWTRLGAVGLLAGGWAIVAAVRRGWHLFRVTDADVWPIALGLVGGLMAMVGHGLIDNSLFLVDLMALFVLGMGVLQRLGERERKM